MGDTNAITKERIAAMVEGLPTEALAEVVTFLESQHFKLSSSQGEPAPKLESAVEPKPRYRPTPMGGLFKGANITAEDIAEARREMWGNFGDRDF